VFSTTALIWLLLFAFICNDGEELLTAERWVGNNRDQYRRAAKAFTLDPDKPMTAQFAVAVAVVGSFVLLATWVGASTFAATGRLHPIFVAVLVMIFCDGVKHMLMSLYLRGYTSGVVSAALVQVPYGAYAIHRFLEAGLVTWGDLLRYGPIGIVAVFPVLWLGFVLGRRLVPSRHATAV
jgi:hypothetical protein